MDGLSDYIFILFLFVSSSFAGVMGAMTGLGGGIIIVPILILLLKINVQEAIATSLVAVIATSSGTFFANAKKGFCNDRIALFLCLASVTGAFIGGSISGSVSMRFISFLFGAVLIHSAYTGLANKYNEDSMVAVQPSQSSTYLELYGTYASSTGRLKSYCAQHIWWGFFLMFIAGFLSSLLGIGSGSVKVLAMDKIMRLPFKVSTSTSNFMIGVTALAGVGFYSNGFAHPYIVVPVVVGVVFGAVIGSRLIPYVNASLLRRLFSILILIIGLRMLFNGSFLDG